MKCPECGKFTKDNTAIVSEGYNEIVEVVGICKKHGKVKIKDWEYEDFYPINL